MTSLLYQNPAGKIRSRSHRRSRPWPEECQRSCDHTLCAKSPSLSPDGRLRLCRHTELPARNYGIVVLMLPRDATAFILHLIEEILRLREVLAQRGGSMIFPPIGRDLLFKLESVQWRQFLNRKVQVRVCNKLIDPVVEPPE